MYTTILWVVKRSKIFLVCSYHYHLGPLTHDIPTGGLILFQLSFTLWSLDASKDLFRQSEQIGCTTSISSDQDMQLFCHPPKPFLCNMYAREFINKKYFLWTISIFGLLNGRFLQFKFGNGRTVLTCLLVGMAGRLSQPDHGSCQIQRRREQSTTTPKWILEGGRRRYGRKADCEWKCEIFQWHGIL